MIAFLLVLNIATAANVTEAPGALQGNIGIHNEWSASLSTLYEAEEVVGKSRFLGSSVAMVGEFGIMDSLSLSMKIPYNYQKLFFSQTHVMEFEPSISTGTYLGSEEGAKVRRAGQSLGGIWFGLNALPFHERIHSDRGDTVSWKVGIGYKLRAQHNFLSPSEDGSRGGNLGASALTLHTAFSKHTSIGQPYLTMDLELCSPWNDDIRNEKGKVVIKNAKIDPANHADFRAGAEVFAWEDTALGHHLGLDFYGKFGYEGWQDVPSGIYLPSVLESTEDMVVTQTERMYAQGGLGLNFQLYTLSFLRLYGEMGVMSPQVIEHVYQVNNLGTLRWSTGAEFRIMKLDTVR
jgi:hypothetical protein